MQIDILPYVKERIPDFPSPEIFLSAQIFFKVDDIGDSFLYVWKNVDLHG